MDGRRGSGPWALAARMGLFLIPVLAVLGVGEAALRRTGEAWTAADALGAQLEGEGEALYGRGVLSQQFNVYKLEALRRIRAPILVLGSSRVMQLRALAFAPREREMYNAGGLLQGVPDLVGYADRVASGDLPSAELYLVGVDPWWIKTGGSPPSWLDEEDAALDPGARFAAVGALLRQRRLLELLQAPRRSPHYGYPAIGALALTSGSGFRRDGSRQYSPRIVLEFVADPVYRDRERPPIVDRIRNHTNPFTLPASVDGEAVDALVDALVELRASGEVVVLFPPVTAEVLAAMEADAALAPLLRAYRETLPARLRAGGVQVVPMSTPEELGMDDRAMIDGFHGSEVLGAALLARAIDDAPPGSRLRTLDLEGLRARVRDAALPLAFEIPPDFGAGWR